MSANIAAVPLAVAAITLAEALVASGRVVLGLLVHAAVLLAAWMPGARDLTALGLLPLLRLASVTVPLLVAPWAWPLAVVAVPVAAVLAQARYAGNVGSLGLRVPSWRQQTRLALGAAGLLALGAFLVLGREERALASLPASAAGRLGAVALLFLSGALEEVVYRGAVQGALERIAQRASVPWTAALSAAMVLGSRSPAAVAFSGLAGLALGWAVRRTGSILGVAVARGLLFAGSALLGSGLPQ